MLTSEKAVSDSREVNLEEATRLVATLEADLAQMSASSADLQRLRDEVQTLKNVLNSPVRRSHWVAEGLHGIRDAFDDALDTAVAQGLKGGQYIAEIGRILGL